MWARPSTTAAADRRRIPSLPVQRLVRQIKEEDDENDGEMQAPPGWAELPRGSLQVAASITASDTDGDVEGPPGGNGNGNGGGGNGVWMKELLGAGTITSKPGG